MRLRPAAIPDVPHEMMGWLLLAGFLPCFNIIGGQFNRLRRKLERDPANPLFLQAVRGIGYRLVASP